MVSKSERSRNCETFEFILDHPDIVDMMQDPDVLLDGGNVPEGQEFAVVVRRPNGAETIMYMRAVDLLIIRYSRLTDMRSDTDYQDVDILP